MRTISCAVLVFTLVLVPFTAAAEQSEIKIDLKEKTSDPIFPAVNNWANDSIVIRLEGPAQAFGAELKDNEIYSTFNLACLDRVTGKMETHCVSVGRFITVSFSRCERIAETKVVKPGNHRRHRCPDAEFDSVTNSWEIYTEPRTVTLTVYGFGPEVPDAEAPSVNVFSLPVRVEQKPFTLGWSAGFLVSGLRDERFRLEPEPEVEGKSRIVQVSDGDYPSQLVAFAHYLPYELQQQVAASFGLGVDVPLDNLSLMLGVSWPIFRTFVFDNYGYITTGVIYGNRNELASAYEGVELVSNDLEVSALVEEDNGFSLFVALSFGFFQGEERFKGVYPAVKPK